MKAAPAPNEPQVCCVTRKGGKKPFLTAGPSEVSGDGGKNRTKRRRRAEVRGEQRLSGPRTEPEGTPEGQLATLATLVTVLLITLAELRSIVMIKDQMHQTRKP